MKKILIATAACMLTHLTFGQIKEGKIIYERKVNMHKRLTDDQQAMRNMVPEFMTTKMQLLFSEHESIFKQLEEDKDIRDQAGEAEEGRMMVRVGGENEVYKNYALRKVIELRELGPKKYIIEDSIQLLKWKLDDEETKSIKGYNCKKATTKNSQGLPIIAWYTDQIICPGGPELFGGLPGMILELNIGDGEIVFTLFELSNGSDHKLVKAPTNGKKISRKEFQKMVEEQFGELSGRGPVMRIIRND